MKSGSKYFVYILECSDGTFYTGITNNLDRRIRQHNGEIVGGAFYTKNKRPVKLIYKEECKTHSAAIKREIAVKKLKRSQKQMLILAK